MHVHFLITENWWSVLEPPLFLKIVELFKEVVVHLLKLYKIGIPPSERRIFNSFLHTALKVLEILHRVCPIVPLFSSFPIPINRLVMFILTLLANTMYIIEIWKCYLYFLLKEVINLSFGALVLSDFVRHV